LKTAKQLVLRGCVLFHFSKTAFSSGERWILKQHFSKEVEQELMEKRQEK